jgi:hypothetical protein
MHEKVARLSGVKGVRYTKGTPVDHCCGGTAGLKRVVEQEVEEIPAKLKKVF